MMFNRSSIDSSSSSASNGGTSPSSLGSCDSFPMRVFLVQTAQGLFSSSGGYRANISLLRYLASQGHCVRQLCNSYRDEIEDYVQTITKSGGRDPRLQRKMLHLRAENGKPSTGVEVTKLIMEDGVEVVALEKEALNAAFGGKEKINDTMGKETAEYIENGKLSARLSDFVTFFQNEIIDFSPTHIMSNDGLSMQASSFAEMPYLDVCRVAVVHTAEQLPFGPFAGGLPGHTSSPREFDLLRQLDGVWSISNAIKRYALEHGQLETDFFVHHPWTYLEEKKHQMPVHLHNWDKKFVGMINPCPVKGSEILINIAKACPHLDFLAYKSWGFNADLGKQMDCLENMTTRPSCANMDEAWQAIKVLLVPSVWFEAWGIVVIEAHLRGIPVICSNAGALSETMRGLDHVISVNAINGERNADGAYVVPEQDVTPWVEALNELMCDRRKYEKLSKQVREATKQWLEKLDETALETWLIGLATTSDKHGMF